MDNERGTTATPGRNASHGHVHDDARGAVVPCRGCGGHFSDGEGEIHPYMLSSSACWNVYGALLAREYSDPALLQTHRLSVDTYAAQHPGDGSRRAIQSTGLHLARLMLQLDRAMAPAAANDAMLRLGREKASLPPLEPPAHFSVTMADYRLDCTTDEHRSFVQGWALATWNAWSAHHDFIGEWAMGRLADFGEDR